MCARGTTGSGTVGRGLQSEDAVVVFARSCGSVCNKPPLHTLGYEPHKEEYCHRRGVYFHQHRCTIGLACAQAVAIRGAPTSRAVMLCLVLCLVPCIYALP